MPLPKLQYKSYDLILEDVLNKLDDDFTVSREVGARVRYRVAYRGEDLLEFTVGPSAYDPHNEDARHFGSSSLIMKKVCKRSTRREDWTAEEKALLGKAGEVLRDVRGALDTYAYFAPMMESSRSRQLTAERVEAEHKPGHDILPDRLELRGKYGTCRDLTTEEVKAIVVRCREFRDRGGKITAFYEQLNIVPGEPRSFELETLRGWLKNPKFTS